MKESGKIGAVVERRKAALAFLIDIKMIMISY